MASTYFELTDGDLEIAITITENADGTLQFEAEVLSDTGTIGDLNGMFFDIGDESLLDGMSISGDDVTDSRIDANSVTKVDGFNNVNGEVANDYGKFDVGIQFGTSGMATDDIQYTSFTLSHDTEDLSLSDFLSQDFAVRLTSVGTEDDGRTDSSKIGGTAPDEPIDAGPIHVANDDVLTVYEDEEFGMFGVTDTLDSGADSILDNDTTDDVNDYLGEVITANDQTLSGQIEVVGSDGGLLRVNPDGTIDFSANGDFDFLTGDEQATTQFTYSIDGGSTANVDVIVFAFEGGDPGDEGPLDDSLGIDPIVEGPVDDGPIDGPTLPPPDVTMTSDVIVDDPFLIG